MADIFRKYNKQNYPPPPLHHPGHHCKPNINININNDDNDSGSSSLSPIIIDLLNRINKVENKVEDIDQLSGSNIQLGENEGQAYPGEKGKENTLDIRSLKNDVNSINNNIGSIKNDVNSISGELINKANKNEIPDPEIYYVNEFPEIPSISGIYIKGNETKFWNGNDWFTISLKAISNLSDEASDEEVPTAKAVYNALSELNNELNKYATDDEVSEIVNVHVNEVIEEKIIDGTIGGMTGNEASYENILNSINNFNNKI